MITCELKDKVLYKIVNESPDMFLVFNINDSLSFFGENKNIIRAILDDFENNGLINQDSNLGGIIMIQILVSAHDLVAHGGFTAKEELLIKNFENLLLEIENLKPSIPDKVEKITSIISGIASALALFTSK